MTDCFQPCERIYRNTYNTIKLLNTYGIHYLIVTKSDMVAEEEYISIMDRKLAHIQITVTSTDASLAASYENAVSPFRRIRAIEKLQNNGFDIQIRLSPFIPEFLDFDIINNIKCKKALVEFLRANAFIKSTFKEIDYSKYTHKENGYYHLELSTKIELIKMLTCFEQISVCEDCTEAYEYWKKNVNYNQNDCCNLSLSSQESKGLPFKHLGNMDLMRERKTAFLCSSGAPFAARDASLRWAECQCKSKHCIISGFQSETERTVFEILLSNGGHAIMLLPHSLFDKCPLQYQNAVNEGRLLILSFSESKQHRITKANAEKRNKQVIEYADDLVIGYVKKSGMIDLLIQSVTKPIKILFHD